MLSRPSIEPGGQLVVQGNGCPAGSTVVVSVDGNIAGTTLADGSGAFSTPLAVPDLALGSHTVTADCGPVLTANLEVAIATSVDAGTGVLGLFFFFFLLSIMLFRRRRLMRPKRRPTEPLTDESGTG